MLSLLLMTQLSLGSTINDPIPAGFGRVCVLRPNRLLLGVGVPFEVSINDIHVGVLRDGKTLCVDVESETVVISVVEGIVPQFVAKAGFTSSDAAELNGEYAIDQRIRGQTPEMVLHMGEPLIMGVVGRWEYFEITRVQSDWAEELFFEPVDPVDQYVTQIVRPKTPPPTRQFTDEGASGATVLAPKGPAPLDPSAFDEEIE